MTKSRKLQKQNKLIESSLPHTNSSPAIASQFKLSHELNNPNIKTPISSQKPFSYSNSQFALNYLPLHRSNSNIKSAANTLKKSESKECEQSEQLSPISRIFETKSTNHHKFSKLGAKLRNSISNYHAHKNSSLFEILQLTSLLVSMQLIQPQNCHV